MPKEAVMFGPKLQDRWNRNVGKTLVDAERIQGRLARLGKSDLPPQVASDIATALAALASFSGSLGALQALVSADAAEVVAETEGTPVTEPVTEVVSA
jgi:hypothetical protein